MVIHRVRRGESLYSIGRDYGVNPAQMAADNGLSPAEPLVVGQTVVVLFPDVVHIVRPGQTLFGIARQYGVSVETLQRNNRWLMGRTGLRPEEVLVISYFGRTMGELTVNGYAYPSIGAALLESTLPYLSRLTPFTYGITRAGALLPLDDEWMRSLAQEHAVGALLHLSTVTEEGAFSNGRSGLVLRDATLCRQLIVQVVDTVLNRGYVGVDVDYEYLPGDEREPYAAFIAQLRSALSPYGRSVTVALAPKTGADQKGLLYEGHDYGLLGAAADDVFLMTYEWGYTYGPPMAVAPLPQVRGVLDYALTEIPAEKILLGVPLYGYDWPLPFRQGSTRARSLSCEQAVALARQTGAEIQYDETAQAPWFTYRAEDGTAHEVWFEDAQSLQQKLLLALGQKLRGVGYWNLDRPAAQNWLVLHALCSIRKNG